MLDDMFGAFCQLLQCLADEPATWNGPLQPLVPQTQLVQRAAINATDALNSGELLHTLFLAQVAQHADHPAVIHAAR